MSKYRSTSAVASFAVLTLFMLLAPTTLAANGAFQSATPLSVSVTDGITQDAQIYAAHYGVDIQEAQRRLERQDTIGALNAALQNGEKATFAGLRIEHRPTYRIVAQFTRDGEQIIQRYTAGGPLDGLIETEVAGLTLDQLETAQVSALRTLRPLGIPLDAGLNMAGNRAEIYVIERARLETALRTSAILLPDGVAIVTTSSLAQPVVDVYAGLLGMLVPLASQKAARKQREQRQPPTAIMPRVRAVLVSHSFSNGMAGTEMYSGTLRPANR